MLFPRVQQGRGDGTLLEAFGERLPEGATGNQVDEIRIAVVNHCRERGTAGPGRATRRNMSIDAHAPDPVSAAPPS